MKGFIDVDVDVQQTKSHFVIHEIVEILHHYLLEHIQVSD